MATQRVRRNRTMIIALILVAVLVIWMFVSCSSGDGQGSPTPASTFANGPFPAAAAMPPRASGVSDTDVRTTSIAELADATWVKDTAKKTGIPRRALAAYAGMAVRLAYTQPDCGLTWNTLAGIGWVESHHGTIFGGKIASDGTASEPIFGVSLDGSGDTIAMDDFDDGNFDGDPNGDRAVGPMQIIPMMWAAWHSDGNMDGVEDGQNIDDSVFAAAGYICYSANTVKDREGWNKGIYAYNQLGDYPQMVAEKADEYARTAG